MLRRLLGPALIAAVAAFSGHARAQDAQALFDEGLGNMKAGRFKLGCALIRRSLDVDARPGTVFTLAECYSRAGKFASAVSYYDHFLAAFDAMPAEQQEQQRARAEVSRSERTRLVALVAWLTVILPPLGAPGIVVTLDGEEFPPSLFGVATAVDPGPHIFTTRAPDGPLVEQRVDMAPGERKTVVLEVPGTPPLDGATAAPASPGQPADRTRPHGISPWVFVTGGIGVAGLITGSISGGLLLADRSTIQEECPISGKRADGTIPCRSDRGYAASQRAQGTLGPLTTVALSVGAAGAIAAVLIFLVDGTGSSRAQSRTIPVVAIGPNEGAVGVRTLF